MEILNSCNDLTGKKIGVGLGNFDGIHLGHGMLIEVLNNYCSLFGLESMIYTFTKHPENILRKSLFTPILTPVEKKIELLRKAGLSYTYFEEFDEDYSRMTPENFVKEILLGKLGISLAVAGFHYRFGYKGSGDVHFLKEMGQLHNFKVIVIPPVKIDNEVASSTAIRNYALKGEMEKAFRLLGRYYSIRGFVGRGNKIGTGLGFPTANILPEEYLLIPSEGVYATRTFLDGRYYPGITNIGKNPTVKSDGTTTIETHLFDFTERIYGKAIEVYFIVKIRDERKFKGKNELISQINKDIEIAKVLTK